MWDILEFIQTDAYLNNPDLLDAYITNYDIPDLSNAAIFISIVLFVIGFSCIIAFQGFFLILNNLQIYKYYSLQDLHLLSFALIPKNLKEGYFLQHSTL